MPQVSLYFDEEMQREIEVRAKLSGTSVSKFVVNSLKTYLSKSWPTGYEKTFGSITDDSFVKQSSPDAALDVKRECL